MEISDVFRRKLVFATFRFHFFACGAPLDVQQSQETNNSPSLSLFVQTFINTCKVITIRDMDAEESVGSDIVKALGLHSDGFYYTLIYRMTILSYMYSVCSMSTCVKNDL